MADKPIYEPCVQCGWCCEKRSCGYGYWDSEKKQCIHLTDEKLCGVHDQIIALEKDEQYPMFDNYCSQPLFNDVRDAKIASMSEPDQLRVKIQELRAALYGTRNGEDTKLYQHMAEAVEWIIKKYEAKIESLEVNEAEKDDG